MLHTTKFKFLSNFQSLVQVEISPQTMRLSICDYLSDSVRSKVNYLGPYFFNLKLTGQR